LLVPGRAQDGHVARCLSPVAKASQPHPNEACGARSLRRHHLGGSRNAQKWQKIRRHAGV